MVLISPRLLRQNPSLFQHKKFALTSEKLRKTKVTTANDRSLFDLSIGKTNPTKSGRRYWSNSHRTNGRIFFFSALRGKICISESQSRLENRAKKARRRPAASITVKERSRIPQWWDSAEYQIKHKQEGGVRPRHKLPPRFLSEGTWNRSSEKVLFQVLKKEMRGTA